MKNICILFLFASLLMDAQAQFVFKGKVFDRDHTALIGVNVTIPSLNKGITTDDRGHFEIMGTEAKMILKFSYTGYATKELEVEADLPIEIILDEGVLLDEAVVTALGIKRQERSLGYAVEKINGKELTLVPEANIVNLLSGKAAGLMVMGSSGGNLGGSARFLMRGVRSIHGENQALFVVDGVPMDNSNFTNFAQVLANGSGTVYESQRDYGNAIQDLNPDDIEEVNVLKSQAAAALYGSRGSNGVIMVTTKKARSPQKGIGFSVNSSILFDQLSVYPKFQRTYGGGVDLLPFGYTDATGQYKIPFVEFGPQGDTIGIFQSFDLIPIYGVDESNGTRFQISTDEHFKHLDELTIGENNFDRFLFLNGYGTNQQNLYYRNWNSWDVWDVTHFGKSVLWKAGDDPREFFETGVRTRFNVAFEQHSERVDYRLSYTRFDQQGIYPNSKLGKHTFALNGSAQLGWKLHSTFTANYIHSSNTGRTATTYDFRGGFNPGQNFSQWWQTQLTFDELKNYEDPFGNMRTWNRQSYDNPRPQYWDNPYWTRYKNYATDGRDRIYGHVSLTYSLKEWLKLTGRILNDHYHEIREERIAEGSLLQAQYTQDLYDVRETNADLILRAEKNMNERLFVTALLGTQKLWRKTDRNFGATLGGLINPGIYRLQNSKERPILQNYLSQKQIESFFGGISMEWKHMLYLDLTGRQDWSSTLPENNNGYFYPSASLAYVFTESWNIPQLSFGKLRLSWAQVGGDGDPYSIYTTFFGNPNFGDLPNYTVPNTLNNNSLRAEQTQSIEAGFDLRFFNNKLGLDLSVYTSKTTDQIVPLPTSSSTGFTRQIINTGEVQNKGLELSLRADLFKTKNFHWNSAFHFGTNTNKLISIFPEDPSIVSLPLALPGGGISINATIGEAYGVIMGTNYIFDKNGNRLVNPNNGTYLVSPGVMPIGNINPDFMGGWSNEVQWKNFQLSFLIDFRKGGDIFSITNLFGRYSGLLEETAEHNIRENGYVFDGVLADLDSNDNPIQEGGANTQSLEDDYYKSTGIKNNIQVPYNDYKFFAGGYHINKQDLYDGSFIKFRELAISYQLPEAWLQKIGITYASVGFVARNLWILFKNIPHIDPEIAVSTNNIQGNEGGAVPSTRSFGMQVNLKF